ncbi:MAG: metal-binding protein [Thermosynechococcaceae cyanobacterium]
MSVEPAPAIAEREWWAQRWIDVLESFGWRRRLKRARNYAREGRVLQLAFQGAQVMAQVQGTAPEPYEVTLGLDPFSDEQWDYVVEELSQRAIFAAKLLAGEMPQAIEDAFTASGLSLFPFSKFDIHSRCNCPDPVNPCKHIGAVYYLLGDSFSRDPFILFELRGRTQQQIMDALRQLRSSRAEDAADSAPAQGKPRCAYPDLNHRFWHYDAQLDPSLVVIAPPPTQDTVLDVLGPLPLPDSPASPTASSSEGQRILALFRQIYQQVHHQSLMTAMTNREKE